MNLILFIKRRWDYYVRCKGDRVAFLRLSGVQIGERCRIHRVFIGSEPWLIRIGDNVTVSDDVRFITHDGSTRLFRQDYPALNQRFGNIYGTIVIEANVFIGAGAILMPNIVIGRDSIVGAGSVVTRSVPARSVAAGNPARVVKTVDEFIAEHLESYLPLEAQTQTELRQELVEKLWGEHSQAN